jgi:hypothetical protein
VAGCVCRANRWAGCVCRVGCVRWTGCVFRVGCVRSTDRVFGFGCVRRTGRVFCVGRVFRVGRWTGFFNVFWTEPAERSVGVLARALRPGGRLLIAFVSDGPTTGDRVTRPIAAGMAAAGLTRVRVIEHADASGVMGYAPG